MKEGNQDSNQQFGAEEEINIQPEQNEETRIQKSEETYEPLRQTETFQYLNHRGARRRRERAWNWKLIWKNNEGKPNLAKEIDFQEVQEAQRVPQKLDPKRNTPRYIIIKLPKIKDKERILKAAREKETITYKWVPIRLSADFSKETLQARRGWKEVFEVMKGKDLHPRWLYPAKVLFRMEGQIKCFPDKVKLKEFVITKPLLYEMLKGLM